MMHACGAADAEIKVTQSFGFALCKSEEIK